MYYAFLGKLFLSKNSKFHKIEVNKENCLL